MPERPEKREIQANLQNAIYGGRWVNADYCEAVERERDEAIGRRDFTVEWYAERLEAIKAVAKREGIWPEIAAIIANGGDATTDPPRTYGALLNSAKYAAKKADSDLAEAQADARELWEALLEVSVIWQSLDVSKLGGLEPLGALTRLSKYAPTEEES